MKNYLRAIMFTLLLLVQFFLMAFVVGVQIYLFIQNINGSAVDSNSNTTTMLICFAVMSALNYTFTKTYKKATNILDII